MRRLLLFLALLLGAPWGSAAQESVVLVVRADSAVTDLDSVMVRKLFLGVPVLVNGTPLRAVRNRADERLDLIFLQEVVAMSQSTYDRQILIGINRQGWLRPLEARSSSQALEKVYADPNTVTFVWQREVAHDARVRMIRVVWTE
jgi:hypothetical protein